MNIFPDNFDIQMRRCFAFDETDTKLQLVDNRGCAIERLISDFTYDKNAGTAEATLYSMFRLPHSNRTYFQCDVLICRGKYLFYLIMNSDSCTGCSRWKSLLGFFD